MSSSIYSVRRELGMSAGVTFYPCNRCNATYFHRETMSFAWNAKETTALLGSITPVTQHSPCDETVRTASIGASHVLHIHCQRYIHHYPAMYLERVTTI